MFSLVEQKITLESFQIWLGEVFLIHFVFEAK